MKLLSRIYPILRAVKHLSTVTVIVLSLHFVGHGIVCGENFLALKAIEGKDFVVDYYAKVFNLVPSSVVKENIPVTSLSNLAGNIALEHDINPTWFRSLIKSESNWNVNAIAYTKKGDRALGLGQVLSSNTGTGKLCSDIMNEKEAYDPVKNLRCSALIFKTYLKTYNHDPVKAIRKYKASYTCVNGGCPEVEEQVKEVLLDVGKSLPVSLESKV